MMRYLLTKILESEILMILCVFAVIGITRLIYDFCLLKKRKRFGEKYLSKYKQLRRSNPFDEECYQWLLRKVDRMQTEMGGYGIIDHYRPAYANNVISNYLALPNTLLNIRTPAGADLAGTQALLERYIGALEDAISKKWKEMFNPLIWLTQAVRSILFDVPLWICRSVGLISGNTQNKIRNHSLVNPITGVISLFYFFASLASLLSGWDPLVKFLSRIFDWLRSIGIN